MIVNKFHTPRSGTGEVAFVGNQRQRNRSYLDGHRANSLSRNVGTAERAKMLSLKSLLPVYETGQSRARGRTVSEASPRAPQRWHSNARSRSKSRANKGRPRISKLWGTGALCWQRRQEA
jgi:hypothetical protein